MDNFIYGFYLGASLIIAMGPQNLFVIEQGLKKEHVFLVCLICAFSDFLFIVIGATAFNFLSQSNPIIDLILNLLLLIFILNFIRNKIYTISKHYSFRELSNLESLKSVIFKTLVFTYLNPHVYSDTIFIIGGFSREFEASDKIIFVIGATAASFFYFFALGYGSSYLANFINNEKSWQNINRIVICTMLFLSTFVLYQILLIIFSLI